MGEQTRGSRLMVSAHGGLGVHRASVCGDASDAPRLHWSVNNRAYEMADPTTAVCRSYGCPWPASVQLGDPSTLLLDDRGLLGDQRTQPLDRLDELFQTEGYGFVVRHTASRPVGDALSRGSFGPLATTGHVVSGEPVHPAVAITSLAEVVACLVGPGGI
jgi:hypothetical protein